MAHPEIVLVRHGETAWTLSGQHTGRTDVALTEGGRLQAASLATRLSATTFATVVTSPLSRAAETCRLAGLDDDALVWDDVVEWNYGDYDGRTTPEIRAERPGWSLWRDGVPNGETADEVGSRADTALARLAEIDGAVAVFSHGHFLRVLAARWLGLEPRDGRLFLLAPASISVLGWEREQHVLRLWNDIVGNDDPG